LILHEKNDFAEKRNIAGYRSENNFIGLLKIMSNAAKNFDNLATSLSVLHNYFDSSTKFSPYPAKILDLSAKVFFLCVLKKLILCSSKTPKIR